jgi:class 3 adenylate cyclase/tetratricopeptide (TPR) repeat protein
MGSAVSRCAGCGTENALTAGFCVGCGSALGAVEGERKQVTILFVDVKGSTDLSGSMTAEEWWVIMESLFGVLAEGVERFGGRVDQFTGDGIMAAFGAPRALEDHAQRACHAALWLRDAVAHYARDLEREQGLSLAIRMGINSGEVVAGTIGNHLSAEYATIGFTPALAQRMESLAEPGNIFLTESTAGLVRGFFAVEARGAMRVKGVPVPVPVFALLDSGHLRTRFEASQAGGLSRFVGRGEELARLQRALSDARSGDGQTILLAGEPGVGKSRLCHEFVEGCRRDGIDVWQAHALAHTTNVPFMPVLRLLRDYFGIAGDDEPNARTKVTERLTTLRGDFDDPRLLLEFLGIQDPAGEPLRIGPQARQRRLFNAVDQLLRAQSATSPGVIFIEDLQWLDAGSAAFLANLVAALAGTRTLLVGTHRFEYQAEWMSTARCHQLRLRSLEREAIEALLDDLLGADPSLDGLRELVHARSAGNPFFVEEIVKSLGESGALQGDRGGLRLARTIEEVEIPATVESVLAARIDRLGDREKRVLQIAAVVGRQFAAPVMRRVTGLTDEELDRTLGELCAAELVLAEGSAGDYMFKHALAEQVAYRTQLSRRRARNHAVVATAIAEQYPDRLDELAALVSHHWETAGEPIQAAQWSTRAAGWAGFNDPNEALRQWRNVRRLAEIAGESDQATELALTSRMMLLNLSWREGVPEGQTREDFERDGRTIFEEATALSQATGNVVAETVTLSAYGAGRGLGGHLEDMADLGMRAVRLAGGAGESWLKLSVLPCPVYALYSLGRYAEVLELVEEGIGLLPDDPGAGGALTLVCPYAWLLSWQAVTKAATGSLADAFPEFDRALALSREYGDFETESWTHMSIVQAMQLAGGGDEAMSHARQAREIAERAGGAFSVGLAWRYLCIAHLLREEWRQAIDAGQRAISVWRPRRVGLEAEPHALTMLARAYLGGGNAERAVLTAQQAVSLAGRRRTQGHELEARIALVQALLAFRGTAAAPAAGEHLRRAQTLLASTGARTLAPRVHAELAELARLRGDTEAYDEEFLTARRLSADVGARPPSPPPVIAGRG